jgi:hypothetical protein
LRRFCLARNEKRSGWKWILEKIRKAFAKEDKPLPLVLDFSAVQIKDLTDFWISNGEDMYIMMVLVGGRWTQ